MTTVLHRIVANVASVVSGSSLMTKPARIGASLSHCDNRVAVRGKATFTSVSCRLLYIRDTVTHIFDLNMRLPRVVGTLRKPCCRDLIRMILVHLVDLVAIFFLLTGVVIGVLDVFGVVICHCLKSINKIDEFKTTIDIFIKSSDVVDNISVFNLRSTLMLRQKYPQVVRIDLAMGVLVNQSED